ncbi:MAG: OmpA family protein, partial [Saprospiraceae bacterium]
PTPYCEYYEKEEKKRALESITSQDIRFETNSSTLDAKDKLALDSMYTANLERKKKIFIIIGYTDSETADNVTLSKARADSVKSYLSHTYKVNELNFITYGLSSSHPVAGNSTNSGRQQNRRATIWTSDLDISQVVFRKGLAYLKVDSTKQAFLEFVRWLRIIPPAQKIEILIDPRLEKLKHSSFWKLLVEKVKASYSNYFDANGAFYLDSLFFEDQMYRRFGHSLAGYIEEIDTIPFDRFEMEIDALRRDSLNFLSLQKYLDHMDYPEISKVGRRQARAAGYVILHNGDSLVYQKYIPILKALCMEGEAEWDIFAHMTDKLHWEKHEPQEYGTQYTTGLDGGNDVILYLVDDLEKVNLRRKKIGMGPIAPIINE